MSENKARVETGQTARWGDRKLQPILTKGESIMNGQDIKQDQGDDAAQHELADLETPKAEEIRGGTKLPPPTTPISAPPPPRK
jgi:hypothetical protein